jgi:hypothetical protein
MYRLEPYNNPSWEGWQDQVDLKRRITGSCIIEVKRRFRELGKIEVNTHRRECSSAFIRARPRWRKRWTSEQEPNKAHISKHPFICINLIVLLNIYHLIHKY